MANPQPDQFTKLSNELLNMIPKYKFNGTQLRLVIVIWRYTYGFNRKHHEFSLSFLLESLGLTHKQLKQVKREVDRLIELKVFTELRKPTKNSSRVLSFNKDYEQWMIETSGQIEPLDKLDQCQWAKKTSQPLDKLDQQERNIKENIKESTITTKEIEVEVYEENGLDLIERFYMEKVLGSANIGTKDMQLILEAYQTYPVDFIIKCMEQACNRYREKYGEMNIKSFKYFESIFKDEWTKLKIREKAESVVPEEPVIDFSKRNVQKQQKQISGKPNKFHNFEQRTAKYSKEELERMVKEKG